ncbi:MAG TPA: hypothetical protein VJA26_13730 [Gammaproteobacteria bacterium]|nr:hypothetical protein [Gammaproteobacteria bacterium]
MTIGWPATVNIVELAGTGHRRVDPARDAQGWGASPSVPGTRAGQHGEG